jgi:peroxiredoxin Q/BCP
MSDPEHKVLEAYDAWGEKKMYGKTTYGVIRSHYLIDEKGKLIAAQHKVKSDATADWALEQLAG